jgi:GNAT superfamily N-acetyltransferase
MDIELADASDRAAYEALRQQIDTFNDSHTKLGEPDRKLAIFVRNPITGAVQGGLLGISYYRWLMLDIVVLRESMRGAGLGRRLVRAAEAEAVARGCIGVWLLSYSFQAPGFYRRLGYRQIGTLNFANGHHAIFFLKRDGLGHPDPSSGLEITETPANAEETALVDAITAYNLPFAGARDERQFGMVLRDPDTRAVVGGLWARPVYGLLFLEFLILPEHLRGAAIGTRLVRQAEEVARSRGYGGVFLDTFSFQARPFYERLGYSVFTVIGDYPPGHSRFLMAKEFAEKPDERPSLLRRP